MFPIEWQFLPKAADWGDCYCEICRPRFAKYAAYMKRRHKIPDFANNLKEGKPVHRPSPLCRPAWAYYLRNARNIFWDSRWDDETQEYVKKFTSNWSTDMLNNYTYHLVPARPNCKDKWKSRKVRNEN